MNNLLKQMTDEDRAKSKLVKDQKREWALLNLRQEFQDFGSWKELSSKFGVRLPVYYVPGTDIKFIRRMAKKIGVSIDDFVETTGCVSLKEFAMSNINWPCYALCGVFLEWVNSLDGEKIRAKSSLQED